MLNRSQIVLRDATVADAAELVALWSECAAASADDGSEPFSQQMLWREPTVDEATKALSFHLEHRTRRVIIATHNERIVGVVAGDLTTLTPITNTRVLVVNDVQVAPAYRRRSVANMLLLAITSYGEENNCEIVMATVSAHAKESNRYLTKIGFSQIAVLRAIQTGKLQARLSRNDPHTRDTGRLVAVRRTLRRRTGVS